MSREFEFNGTEWMSKWNPPDTAVELLAILDREPYDIITDGWCACGPGEWVAYELTQELRRVANKEFLSEDNLARYLMRYHLDALGMIDHGTTISGAWIEPAGTAFLKLVEGWEPR